MRQVTYKSVIGAAGDAWRAAVRRSGLKDTAMVAELVERHYAAGLDRLSGVSFQRSGDAFRDLKTNGEKWRRWLDESRDQGSLPANVLPTLLQFLPMDIRVELANDLLAGSGLHAELDAKLDVGGQCVVQVGAEVIRETSEANMAMVEVMRSATPQSIAEAAVQVDEARVALERAMQTLRGLGVLAHGDFDGAALTVPAGMEDCS
ncbi:hypothetical protein [Chitiniphilus eburneus]|uniref:hypothetical protein n=1 Tax=Chitiniphilus eburneus TaxID=2571148 RepID=UPI0035D06D6A